MRIDSEVRKYIYDNKRIAKDSFPWTTISDDIFNDVLRAIQLTAGDGFDTLLSGVEPPTSFWEDVRVFKAEQPVLPDPKAALINHFIKGLVTSEPLSEVT